MKKAGLIALLAVTFGVGALAMACGGSNPAGGGSTMPTSTDTNAMPSGTGTGTAMPTGTDTSGMGMPSGTSAPSAAPTGS